MPSSVAAMKPAEMKGLEVGRSVAYLTWRGGLESRESRVTAWCLNGMIAEWKTHGFFGEWSEKSLLACLLACLLGFWKHGESLDIEPVATVIVVPGAARALWFCGRDGWGRRKGRPRNRAVLLHADGSCIGSPDWPPEPRKPWEVPRQLWGFLLEYDGGCKRGVQPFGLTNSETAISLVKQI